MIWKIGGRNGEVFKPSEVKIRGGRQTVGSEALRKQKVVRVVVGFSTAKKSCWKASPVAKHSFYSDASIWVLLGLIAVLQTM